MASQNISTDTDPLATYDTGDNPPAVPAPLESTSTNRDAGLLGDEIVDTQQSESAAEFDAEIDSELMDDDDISTDQMDELDLDEDLDSFETREIPMSNLDIESLDDPVTRDTIRSPELDAPDTPGQIDIEALGDHDLDDTDLPADARLDPIEE